ncbi:MAG TPA: twin-arginine translocase subunit TatB [Clostridiales bacterium]|jgi:sec-independent protein translocase protein TatB|nr:twin-arginine translocase subunit TatB [Clostridiales bacterium]
MFNIGFSEIIVILMVAFFIVGPKDLPKVARALARFFKQMKKMYAEFKEAMGLDDVIEDLKDTEREIATQVKELDPRVDLKSALDDAQKSLKQAERETMKKQDKTTEKKEK